MDSNSQNQTREQHGSQEAAQHAEQADNGHCGEGAASALAHLISQGRQHRHQSGDADDAAGSRHQ